MPNEITQQLQLNRWCQQHTCWYEWPTTLFGNIWIHPHQRLICRNTHTLTTLPTSLTRCVDLPSSCAHCFFRNSIAEQRNGSPILHIFITRNVPHLCFPQKTSTTTRKIVSASPQRSDSVLLEKWSRIEFVNQLALDRWRRQHSCGREQTKWNTSLHMTKICGRTTCRSQHMNLYQCLCSLLGWRTIFDLTTKTNSRHTAWTTPQMCPSCVLRRQRLPRNFVRRKTCYLCASHHVPMTLWSKTSVAEFQSPNQPTNFAWIKCFVHVDNSAENKTKTPTHKPKSAAKLKFELQANRISPPTLHILITGTIHHVCAKRTPRGTRDTTTIPMTVNNFYDHSKNWHYRNKNKRCTTTTLREPFINCDYRQHSNAHDFNSNWQTLDILVTRTLHHVCARRTQRGLVANNNANDNCSQKWYHALQLSTRNNRKKMPQHNTTTTPRGCSDVSMTRVLAHKIPGLIHSTSDTERRHQANCPSRVHPKCDSRLNNSTQDCYYITQQTFLLRCWHQWEKQKLKQHHTAWVAGKNPHPSEPTMNLWTFHWKKLKQHPTTPPRQPRRKCVHHPSSCAHGFCIRSFEQQCVTSDTGHAHQRNRPCVPKRQTECDS